MNRLLRALAYVVLTLVLFVSLWMSRVFLAVPVVSLFLQETSPLAIALVAAAGALLPGVLLGFAYGLIPERPVLRRALAIALGAGAIELVLASLTVNWWEFVTWWVLPLEWATLVVCFPAAAWAGSAAGARIRPVVRRRGGIALFTLLALGIAGWPWL
jgi:hypothetical protein